MRAAVLREFGAPLDVVELPSPEPPDGEVLVRVRAAGVCGTDLKIASGAFPELELPLVPGHEIAGELPDGRRVACYFYDPCGECDLCRSGRDSLCAASRRLGFERDGGFAELVSVPARNVLPIDAAVPFDLAAVAMDAVVTPLHALRARAALRPGESLLVVGAGGLGLNAVQLGAAAGARVAVLDPDPGRRAAALGLGAQLVLAPDAIAETRAWAGAGADVALEASGTRGGFEAAAACVARGGRVVVVGYRPGIEYGLDSSRLALEEIAVVGSRAGTREDARAALDAVAAGAVTPVVADAVGLDDVNWALDRLRAGEVSGRVVLRPETTARM